jgi:hypothetical protein
MSSTEAAGATIRSTIPARLDRPGRSPFHARTVAGLGAAWILDGLQITIASSVTVAGGIVVVLAITAEGKSPEAVTKALTSVDEPPPDTAPARIPA